MYAVFCVVDASFTAGYLFVRENTGFIRRKTEKSTKSEQNKLANVKKLTEIGK